MKICITYAVSIEKKEIIDISDKFTILRTEDNIDLLDELYTIVGKTVNQNMDSNETFVDVMNVSDIESNQILYGS